ncbi:MAG: hypothetical protein WD768_08930 [Phycisphaeraceae bacterium]
MSDMKSILVVMRVEPLKSLTRSFYKESRKQGKKEMKADYQYFSYLPLFLLSL